jgi:hypothetical protein
MILRKNPNCEKNKNKFKINGKKYSKINISHSMRAFQQHQEQAPDFQKYLCKINIY